MTHEKDCPMNIPRGGSGGGVPCTCKYCDKEEVTHYGGVCEPCGKIAYIVRQEEKRYWGNIVAQELNQLIERMK
jgi:hypothetical protein